MYEIAILMLPLCYHYAMLCYAMLMCIYRIEKQQSAKKIKIPHEAPSSLPSGLLGIPSPLLNKPALPFLSGV